MRSIARVEHGSMIFLALVLINDTVSCECAAEGGVIDDSSCGRPHDVHHAQKEKTTWPAGHPRRSV